MSHYLALISHYICCYLAFMNYDKSLYVSPYLAFMSHYILVTNNFA